MKILFQSGGVCNPSGHAIALPPPTSTGSATQGGMKASAADAEARVKIVCSESRKVSGIILFEVA